MEQFFEFLFLPLRLYFLLLQNVSVSIIKGLLAYLAALSLHKTLYKTAIQRLSQCVCIWVYIWWILALTSIFLNT